MGGALVSAIITRPDGTTITAPLVDGGGEAQYVDWGATGAPDNWGQALPTPEPKFFDAIEVAASGKTLLMAPLLGIAPPFLPTDPWRVVKPTDYVYRMKRANHHPVYDQAGHHIDGGTWRLPFRFAPADDPWELRLLSKRTPAQYEAARRLLNMDTARIARWPWLQEALGWFTLNAQSFNRTAAPGTRNEGWLCIPENFMYRWAGQPGGIPALKHWYGFGSRFPGSEGLTNEHYGHAAAWIASAMGGGTDPWQALVNLTVGLNRLRWRIAFGLIDSPGHKWDGRWRNEKSQEVRGSAGTQPGFAKDCWDLDLLLGYTLLPEDTLIARGYQVRGDFLRRNIQSPWSGTGGARNQGNHLETLLLWYRATGDPIFKVSAERYITWAMGPNVMNGALYFNDPGLGVSGGEGVTALAYTLRWVYEHDVRPDLKPYLQQIIAWYVAHAGRFEDPAKQFYKASYYLDPVTKIAQWSGNFQGLWWLPMAPWLPQNVVDGLERWMFTVYQNVTDCDAAFGTEGPGWTKWKAIICYYGARQF